MKNICILTEEYPSVKPGVNAFAVKRTARSLADNGLSVSVICPVSGKTRVTEEITDKGNGIRIICPEIKTGWFGGITQKKTENAFLTGADDMNGRPDAVLALGFSAAFSAALRLASENDAGMFVYTDGKMMSEAVLPDDAVRQKIRDGVNGIICTASSVQADIVLSGLLPKNRTFLDMPSYDPSVFRAADREEARRSLGLPSDCFTVAFAGAFDDTDGLGKLCQAIGTFEDVKLVCIGEGEKAPEGDYVLYSGRADDEKLASFFCASDIFVLPTKSPDAFKVALEAMACGLPVVSSAYPFTADLLDETNSFRIDPDSVEHITAAIGILKENTVMRSEKGDAAKNKAAMFTDENHFRSLAGFLGVM